MLERQLTSGHNVRVVVITELSKRPARWGACGGADRLRYLVEYSEIWPEMGRRARRFVEEKFDMKKLSKRLVKIYEDVIASRLPIRDES